MAVVSCDIGTRTMSNSACWTATEHMLPKGGSSAGIAAHDAAFNALNVPIATLQKGRATGVCSFGGEFEGWHVGKPVRVRPQRTKRP